MNNSLRWASLSIIMLGLLLLGFSLQIMAQSDDDIWATPVNLSQSGAASSPVVVAVPDGSFRILWWDQFDGLMVVDGLFAAPGLEEMEASTSVGEPVTPTLAGENWSAPGLATIRMPQTVIREGQEVVVLAPIEVIPKIVGDRSGRAHAFWLGEPDEDTGGTPLLHSRLEPTSTSWSTPGSIAEFATSFAVTADVTGTAHLVYVRSNPAPDVPIGLSYRQLPAGGTDWSAPATVHSSRYLRLLPPDEDHLRITATETGDLYATWDDPYKREILESHSVDGGATWSQAQPFVGSGIQPQQDRLIALPGSVPAALWAPPGDSQTRLVATSTGNTLKLSAWDGDQQAVTVLSPLRFGDLEQGNQVSLNDPYLMLAPPSPDDEEAIETLIVLGTDGNHDLWITGSSMPNLQALLAESSLTEEDGPTALPIPVNLSRSGAASKPAIVARADGSLYAFWWDQFDGLTMVDGLVVASTILSGTEEITHLREIWGEPRSLPLIPPAAAATDEEETSPYTSPETTPRILADATGRIHAFWQASPQAMAPGEGTSDHRPLLHSLLEPDEMAWSSPAVLAVSAESFDVAPDASGNMHLAFMQPVHTNDSPAGVYYRRLEIGKTSWTTATPVELSRYFRSLSAEKAHLRLAVDQRNRVFIAWDQPYREQLMLAHSPDGGTTWQEPVARGDLGGTWQRGRLFAVPGGEPILVWELAGAPGPCGLVQALVSDVLDGTSSSGQPVLEGLTVCPEGERFLPMDEDMVLMVSGSGSEALTLAMWDGSIAAEPTAGKWSDPVHLGFSFEDPGLARQVYLDDLQIVLLPGHVDTDKGLAGQTILAVGTDQQGDIWATSSGMGALDLVFASPSPWSQPVEVTQGQPNPDLPAMAADTEGQMHILFGEMATPGEPSSGLIYVRWDGERWTSQFPVLQSSDSPAMEPAMVAVGDRLHAIWSNQDGQVSYSQAFAQDAYITGSWSEPKDLSVQTTYSQQPDIVADVNGTLHVAFAVPVNEGRGIYYTRSLDGVDWSPASLVVDAAAEDWVAVGQPHLAVDEYGFIHASWVRASLPGSGPPEGVYYARSLDGGATWSEALDIAEGPHAWPQVVVTNGGQVHIVWQETNDQGTWWHRRSTDAGETWTRPEHIAGFGGVGAPAKLLMDDKGALHLLGLSQDANGISTLLHATWDGNRWNQPEAFRIGAGELKSGVSAAANSALGRLDVLFRGESRADDELQQALWHTGRRTPTVAKISESSFVPQPTPAPTVTPLPAPTPEPTPSFDSESPASGGDLDFWLPVLLALAGATLIVGVILGIRFLWAGRR